MWTESKITTLVRLVGEKDKDYGQIGEILGFSRNAISGKIHRLGLAKPTAHLKKPHDRKSDKVTLPRVSPTVAPVDAPDGYGTLLKAKADNCVYPHPDTAHFVCFKQTLPGKPYCAIHEALTHQHTPRYRASGLAALDKMVVKV